MYFCSRLCCYYSAHFIVLSPYRQMLTLKANQRKPNIPLFYISLFYLFLFSFFPSYFLSFFLSFFLSLCQCFCPIIFVLLQTILWMSSFSEFYLSEIFFFLQKSGNFQWTSRSLNAIRGESHLLSLSALEDSKKGQIWRSLFQSKPAVNFINIFYAQLLRL